MIEFAEEPSIKEKQEKSFAERATHLTIVNLMSHASVCDYFTDYAKNILHRWKSFDEEDKFIATPDMILSGYLRNFFSNQNPLSTHTSVYSDVMMLALGYVDWNEVADRFINKALQE